MERRGFLKLAFVAAGFATTRDGADRRVAMLRGRGLWAARLDDPAYGGRGDGTTLNDGPLLQALADMPQPVVAAIAGVCHGPGLEIALACDIRLAATTATFAAPETGLGTLPRAGGTQRLPRAIGRAQALRMLLTGDTIDAPEASRIGLVSSVLAPEEVEAAARALVRRIADRGPIATRMGKEAVQRGAEMTLEQALRYETDLTVLLQSTADRAEGVRAFAAKRPPRFSGR